MCLNKMFYETLVQRLNSAIEKVDRAEINKNIAGMRKGLLTIESILKDLSDKAKKDRESVALAINKIGGEDGK